MTIKQSRPPAAKADKYGKRVCRVTTDVSDRTANALADLVISNQSPRADVVREALEDFLFGTISRLPVKIGTIDLQAAVGAMATINGLTVEEYTAQVLAEHIFGHLQAEFILNQWRKANNPKNGADLRSVA